MGRTLAAEESERLLIVYEEGGESAEGGARDMTTKSHNKSLELKPLTIEQNNAIDLLLAGMVDREVTERTSVQMEQDADHRPARMNIKADS